MTRTFSFIIFYDKFGNYAINRMEKNIHRHHPKINYGNIYSSAILLTETESQ